MPTQKVPICVGDSSGVWKVVDVVQGAHGAEYRCICQKCGIDRIASENDFLSTPHCHCSSTRYGPHRGMASGTKFGKLTVVGREQRKGRVSKAALYLCQCDCGRTRICRRPALVAGTVTSCTFCSITSKKLIGKRFGMLVILSDVTKDVERTSESRVYRCKCDCGNVVDLSALYLRYPHKVEKSCGCVPLPKRGRPYRKRFEKSKSKKDVQ